MEMRAANLLRGPTVCTVAAIIEKVHLSLLPFNQRAELHLKKSLRMASLLNRGATNKYFSRLSRLAPPVNRERREKKERARGKLN